VRTPKWNVYWRGAAHDAIPELIRTALDLLPDFES